MESLGRSRGRFLVSHRPPESEGWLELLVDGLTFDLTGLAPASPAAPFPFAHRYAVPGQPDPAATETVALAVGAHLVGAEAMMPAVRAAAALAAELASLAGCIAVGWRPARVLSGTAHFRRAIDGWIGGGAFPALGLAALARTGSGELRSEGLKFLIGRELVLAPSGAAMVDDAKLATRLIDWLVESARGDYTATVEALPGVAVTMIDDRAGGVVRAERAAGAERAAR